jgi:MoaA/NifB/PqqE/SkfB family radical SAM enzyme
MASSTAQQPIQSLPTLPTQPFRLDVPLHNLLQRAPDLSPPLARVGHEPRTELALPSPVFPQQPALLHEVDADDIAAHDAVLHTGKRHWPASKVMKTMRGWMVPYLKSRVLPGEFQPIIAYLFTEWKCNLDCHYCWSYDNRVKGMTEDTARRAIDWLESTPCRVLAPTGGEPLIRPDFVHKVIYYAAKKDFWVYLATNARLLRPEVTDHLADAGIATVNFAVDTIKEKPGLPKAFEHVRKNFDYLVRRQYRYGYTVFFNTNICRTNIDDVKELATIAHDNGISITFHVNEAPMMEQEHFKHLHENDTYIRPQDFPVVDELLDWLIDKQRQGWKMVDSIARLQAMKGFMRGGGEHWGCRAGQNWLIIRTNGTPALSHVQRKLRLGHRRKSEVRCPATLGNEKGLRAELFFDTGVQRRLLLQLSSSDEVAMEASPERLPGCNRKLRIARPNSARKD